MGGVFQFCLRHPQVIADSTAISVASVTGQFFIVSMVKEFGALVLAATMNVRQLVSILVSYQLYNHSLTRGQGFGLIVVFAALLGKSGLGFWNLQTSQTTVVSPQQDGIYSKVEESFDMASEDDLNNCDETGAKHLRFSPHDCTSEV